MKLNATILSEDLMEYKPKIIENTSIHFDRVMLLSEEPLKDGVLYLCDINDFVTFGSSANQKSFLIHDPLELLESINYNKNNTIIAIPSQVKMSELTNVVWSLFNRYQKAIFEIKYLLALSPIEDILNKIFNTFGLQLQLVDDRQNILFKNYRQKATSLDVIISKTIREGRKLLGALSLIKNKNHSSKYQSDLFQEIYQIIESIVIKYFSERKDVTYEISRLIYDGIRLKKLELPGHFFEKLNMIGWEGESSYRLILFSQKRTHAMQPLVDFLNTQYANEIILLKLDPYYLAFVHCHKIDSEMLSKEIRHYIQNNSFVRCTISTDFQSPKNLLKHYQFIEKIHSLQKENFIDINHQIIDCMSLLIEPERWEILIHDELDRILQSDLDNDAELLETLYVFLLNERSLVKTAKQLNVHRNTVVYRINKFNEIVTLDLDDPNTRMHVLLSLLVLNKKTS